MSVKLEHILQEFRQICAIPHASTREKELCLYLKRKLRPHAGYLRCDAAGNLMAKIPANNASPDAPTVILQAHMDMVVAGEVAPERATVNVMQDGEWLVTDGRTSLGADNGIGLAVILSLLEQPDLTHGPLHILFTISEEIGLKGARRVSPEFLQEARYLINLDGFHSDTAMVGCKSGLRERMWYPAHWQIVPEGSVACRIRLDGFLGGHSGDDIDRGRCNTIRLMATLLRDLQERSASMAISAFHGGTGFNVISASCTADIVLRPEEAAAFTAAIQADGQRLLLPFRDTDGDGRLTVEEIPCPKACWKRASQRDILLVLANLTDGVVQRGADGAVSASCNMGHAYVASDRFYVEDMLRCDTAAQENAILTQHVSTAKAAGFHHRVAGYHSWHSGADSRLATVVSQVYRQQHEGAPMRVKTALVGVEPAYFQEKAPELEMVCLGADILNAHSVKERVNCKSVEELSDLLEKTLCILAKEGAN